MASSPNGWRGWADLLAATLAHHDPRADYANLALRGKATRQVLREQVAVAAALQPTLATVWVGGNDVMRAVPRFREVLDDVAEAVECLTRAGADVLVLSGMQPRGSVLLRPLAARVDRLDRAMREVVRASGAELVDVLGLPVWRTNAGWAQDRVHPSVLGHRLLALRVAEVLGVPASRPGHDAAGPVVAAPRVSCSALADELRWWTRDVIPHFGRWATNASARERTAPKYTSPVRPANAFAWLADEPFAAGRGGG